MANLTQEQKDRRNARARQRRAENKQAWDNAQQWDRDAEEQDDDYAFLHVAAHGYDPSMYFPEKEGKKIPEEGAWILILEPPRGLALDFDIPLLSMWRARPYQLDSGALRVAKDLTLYPQQAIITTPAGDVHLWPHEYQIASNPMGLVADPDSTLHQLGGAAVLDEDMLFYLMSRGIPEREATLMLFELITSTDFIYVTFPEEITAMLEGVGRSLRRHIALSETRRFEEDR